MTTECVDLMIVGAGPAGLLTSIIASMLGLSHRVIERRGGLHTEPSAHVLKTHSMEVYRRVGVADAVFERATPVEFQQFIIWCESVGGLTYGRLDMCGKKGKVPRFTNISPVHPANLSQSQLEPLLHARASLLAGRDPVAFGASFDGYVEDDDGVTVTYRDAAGPHQVRAGFLIGADGASSPVRRAAGIAMEGPKALAHFLAIHINSDMRPLLERDPGVLFFIRAPTLEGFFIMHQPVGSQVFMVRYDPETQPFESFDATACRALIEEALGTPYDFTISAIDRWAMSAQVAAAYRQGRVLLVGDAGHRFPPTGGLGLNTGVEDVENIVWKLAAVLRGQADMRLLDSYETECRPIALRNTAQSVSNHTRMREVALAIGAEDGPERFHAAIEELRGGSGDARFAAIQQAIDAQTAHFAFLELEMAATATAGAFLAPRRAIPLPVPPEEGYQPSFAPGGHIPHLWLGPDVSTIDCLAFDRFSLFVPVPDVEEWRAAVAALPAGTMPVAVFAMPAGAASARACAADFWGDRPFAILARPDGRIAWVEPPAAPSKPLALAEAIATIMSARALDTVEAA